LLFVYIAYEHITLSRCHQRRFFYFFHSCMKVHVFNLVVESGGAYFMISY
jgi:hypothetical protein